MFTAFCCAYRPSNCPATEDLTGLIRHLGPDTCATKLKQCNGASQFDRCFHVVHLCHLIGDVLQPVVDRFDLGYLGIALNECYATLSVMQREHTICASLFRITGCSISGLPNTNRC